MAKINFAYLSIVNQLNSSYWTCTVLLEENHTFFHEKKSVNCTSGKQEVTFSIFICIFD